MIYAKAPLAAFKYVCELNSHAFWLTKHLKPITAYGTKTKTRIRCPYCMS